MHFFLFKFFSDFSKLFLKKKTVNIAVVGNVPGNIVFF